MARCNVEYRLAQGKRTIEVKVKVCDCLRRDVGFTAVTSNVDPQMCTDNHMDEVDSNSGVAGNVRD